MRVPPQRGVLSSAVRSTSPADAMRAFWFSRGTSVHRAGPPPPPPPPTTTPHHPPPPPITTTTTAATALITIPLDAGGGRHCRHDVTAIVTLNENWELILPADTVTARGHSVLTVSAPDYGAPAAADVVRAVRQSTTRWVQ